MTVMTTIKVPTEVRDRVRAVTPPGQTLAVTIERSLDALDRAQFREAAERLEADESYWAEVQPWMDADLATPRRPE
jgi:hypothetical protein